ncbi:HAMP domain-containing histidine kinase [Bacillus sp. RG28]|uniref:histidine kinase n=1 Tax=Gottfriedia endophytica TaxID=2820819 RepID=A0A940NPZ3_9BACI|nr:HAMP domain-containing sensor histidine kinase [Gottfriedia endophytica]MBP0725423.1 HAMP domain-containing histidine kinase [Gottfriedia endophytica]
MNFTLRIVLQLLLAFVGLFAFVQAILIVTLRYLWPQGETNTQSIGLFVFILCSVLFLLTLFLIGWYLGKPIYFMMIWIRRLAGGNYELPPRWDKIHSRKSGALTIPYAVYKELFEHLRMLAGTLKKNENDLQKSEQAKQEWIRGISHDLKTPLTYISGYSTMLINKEYRWSKTEEMEFLAIIQQKAVHLQELVQDLNETIQGQIPLKKEKEDLVELVRRAVADVGSAPWATGHQFTMEPAPHAILGLYDSKLLTRATRNLLVNAVVHNPGGTEIKVCVSLLNNQTAEIRIEDNGIGFNEAIVKDDAAASSQHSGLGLSIAKQLVAAHGGDLVITSKRDEGTSLSIKLPLAQS